MKTVDSFTLWLKTHIAGRCDCRGCLKAPYPCSTPSCDGLVHSEEWIDGDETGVQTGVTSVCDKCGDIIDRDHKPENDIVEEWDARDRQRARREYDRNPSLSDRVDQILESSQPNPLRHLDYVDPYFTKKEEESKKRMNELGRKLALLYPPDGESAQKDNVTQKEDFETDDEFEVVNPFAPYVDITGVRFRFKWGGLDSLFRDAGNEREAYFAQMMNKLRENPDNSGMRASAIAFYWSLSRFVPGDSTTGYGYREINGEDIWSDDVSYWEPEPGWEDRRLEFRRFLQHIVEMRSPGRDWPSTKWEVTNSFAADEWDRAYHQLRSAVQSSQVPQDAGEALILDCQFNSVFGKEMDLRLGLGMYRDEYFRNEKADLADIKHSLLVCREFDLSGLEQLPEQVCLDYDDRLPPQAFTKFIWNILRPTRSARPRTLNVSFQDLATSFDSLGAIAPYYRSIRAQLAEFSGKIDYAASEYEALSKMELFGTNLAVEFTMRAAELYFEAGRNDKAAELASKATHSAPTDDERQSAYLLLAKAHAVSGNATAAHQALEHLDCETVQGDPLLRMLTTLSRSSDPALVQKRIDKWLFYARLTERSRELLRECAQFLHEAEVQHELRLRNLRIAAQEFAKAIEVELRNRVFEAFKQHVERRGKLDELAGHCCDDRALMGFMRGDVYGSQLGLGAMYRSMNSSTRLVEMKKWTETIQGHSGKILDEVRKMAVNLERQIGVLRESVATLKLT